MNPNSRGEETKHSLFARTWKQKNKIEGIQAAMAESSCCYWNMIKL